jgi:hypothetical protein
MTGRQRLRSRAEPTLVQTGMMVRSDDNQWGNLTVWADRHNVNVGLDLSGGPDDLTYGGSRFATHTDMRGFGPGLQAPHARSCEV